MIAFDKDIPAKVDSEGQESVSGSSVDPNIKSGQGTWSGHWNTFKTRNREWYAKNITWPTSVINFENWPFFWIMFFTFVAFTCALVATIMPNWIYAPDTGMGLGLWNTCQRVPVVNNNTDMPVTWKEGNITIYPTYLQCGRQTFWNITTYNSPESRASFIFAAQFLICTALAFFAISFFTLIAAFFWHNSSNQHLDAVRNWYIVSIMLQMFAFWFMIIGVFVYIYTEQLMGGVMAMFAYFIVAFFIGFIGFIAVDFQMYQTNKGIAAPVIVSS